MDSLTDPVLDSATVTISTGLREGDVLAYPAVGGSIAASYNASSGMLLLSGSVSVLRLAGGFAVCDVLELV